LRSPRFHIATVAALLSAHAGWAAPLLSGGRYHIACEPYRAVAVGFHGAIREVEVSSDESSVSIRVTRADDPALLGRALHRFDRVGMGKRKDGGCHGQVGVDFSPSGAGVVCRESWTRTTLAAAGQERVISEERYEKDSDSRNGFRFFTELRQLDAQGRRLTFRGDVFCRLERDER
jgi:hypothetical protein